MQIDRPFRLSDNFVAKYKRKKAPFGFNGLGELVYNRTYSRLKEDGKNDQKRICTPEESLKNGANKIIMGRSLVKGNIEENIDKVSNSIKE